MNDCPASRQSHKRWPLILAIFCLSLRQILADPIVPQSAVSRKTHGSAGTFDLPLSLTGTASIECRSGGVSGDYQLVIKFAQPVTFSTANVTAGVGNVVSASVNGSEFTINLSGVVSEERVAVTLAGVTDGTNRNDVRVAMNVLIGDVNGDKIVNVGDTVLVRNQSGNTLSNGNYRDDINADGLINVGDVVLVRAHSGTAVSCSEPVVASLSGQDQSADPNSFLSQPLVIQVTCEKGDLLQNVPVTFSSDRGSFTAISGGQTSADLTLNTDQNGFATVYFLTPNQPGVTSKIVATAHFNSSTDSTQFSATTLASNHLATGIYSASLVIQTDGTLLTWGNIPGDGKTARDWPQPLLFLPGASAVSAAHDHVLLLGKDGLVWSWGGNADGQLGDGTTTDKTQPALVSNLSNVLSIAAGGFHSLALQQNGTVSAWGADYYGQLGNNDFSQSVVPVSVSNLSNVTRIAAGYERSLALKADGTVWTWGFDLADPDTEVDQLTPVQVNGLTNVAAIAAGRGHAVAVKDDGTVWAWGSNSNGQLGNGSTTFSASPVQVSNIVNAISVSSSYDHTLAILSDGTVWAWGVNSFGQLGNGTTNASNIPAQVYGLTNIVAVMAAESYSMALQSDGTVWAWGQVNFESGLAASGNALTPQQVSLGLLDQNGNGMDDRWELFYFHNLDQLAIGDFNGNGISNLAEWLAGSDPTWWNPNDDGTVRPAIPANAEIEVANDGSRMIEWTTDDNNGNSFIVERKVGPNGAWLEINRTEIGATSYIDSTSFVNVRYLLYRVRSLDNAGRMSLPTNNLIVPPPPSPSHLSLVKNTDGTVTLSWRNRATNATGFVIEKRVTNGWTQIATTGPNVTTYTSSDLGAGGTYRVRAEGPADLLSPPSNQIPPRGQRFGIIDLETWRGPSHVANNGMMLMPEINNPSIAGYRWNLFTLEPLYANPGAANFSTVHGMNDSGTVVGTTFINQTSVGAIWPVGSSVPQVLPSPYTFGDTGYSSAYILTVDNNGAMYGGILDDPEYTDGYSASPLGWGAKMGTVILPDPENVTKTFGYALEPYRMNNVGGFLASRLDYNTGGFDFMINRQAVSFGPVDINDEGIVLANGDPSGPGPDDGSAVILWNGTENVIDVGATAVAMSSGVSPQVIGLEHGQQLLWERNNDTGSYESTNLSELIPQDSGWTLDGDTSGSTISRNGLIGGFGIYQPVDSTGQPIGSSYEEGFMMIPCELVVDANRDGVLRFTGTYNDPNTSDFPTDTTTSDQPYRFWLNDDDDTEDGSDSGETVPPLHQDWTLHQIASKRNLEDFSRIWIYFGGLQDAIASGKIQVGLQWKNVTPGTSPAINIYPSKDGIGSDSYLKDDNAAAAQISDPVFNNAIVDKNGKQTVDTTSTFIFKSDYWIGLNADNPKKCLLFEGAGEGSGELAIIFFDQNGNQIGEGGTVWLDIKNIKKMYERFDISGQNQWPPMTFDAAPDETNQDIVFVHGWNTSPEGASNTAETVLKRVWWRGYKGRFTAVRWNTYWSSTFNNVPFVGQTLGAYLARYNDSEHNAWLTGEALKNIVTSLPSGYSKNVVAHSMGNVVVGGALRRDAIIDNYALLHAAVPASCYDESAYIEQPPAPGAFGYTYWDTRTPEDDPDFSTRALAYRRQLLSSMGNLINFFLPHDRATTYAWEFNNNTFKPADGFFYDRNEVDGSKLWKNEGGIRRVLTDPEEAMPYADQSWGKVAGAENRTAGAVTGNVDLSSQVYSVPGDTNGFNDDHGAEFNRTVQQLQPFYITLLNKLAIPQNP